MSSIVTDDDLNANNDLNFLSLTADHGVSKIILRHTLDNNEESSAKEGDTCTINYTGFLERNGEEFDSTAYSSAFLYLNEILFNSRISLKIFFFEDLGIIFLLFK